MAAGCICEKKKFFILLENWKTYKYLQSPSTCLIIFFVRELMTDNHRKVVEFRPHRESGAIKIKTR